MKVVILAGGLGTRLAEETEIRPKPMVEIGERPILWHIMKIYAHYGFTEFLVALGYRGDVIKRYFLDYRMLNSSFTIAIDSGEVRIVDNELEDWTVHLIETGVDTQTGGRVKRLVPYLEDTTFMMSYGDGVSDIDLRKLVAFHRSHGKVATVTAVRPLSRFGDLTLDGSTVSGFVEKPQIAEMWVNGGFFVFEPEVMDYIAGDGTAFEGEPMERLARDGQLMAFRHHGFWQQMDTLQEARILRRSWDDGKAPWNVWAS